MKIFRVQELNRFKNQSREDELFHLQRMSSNIKKIESFKKRIKKIIQENVNLIDVFIEFRIILKILQKSNQLAQNM